MSFIEEYLFEILKNKSFSNMEQFKKVVKEYNIDETTLYRKIVNYQINKYGQTLNSKFVEYQDFGVVGENARLRRYHKRIGR